MRRPDIAFEMWLEPGDLQIINSHVTLHSRTEFTDHDDPDQKDCCTAFGSPRQIASRCQRVGEIYTVAASQEQSGAVFAGSSMMRSALSLRRVRQEIVACNRSNFKEIQN